SLLLLITRRRRIARRRAALRRRRRRRCGSRRRRRRRGVLGRLAAVLGRLAIGMALLTLGAGAQIAHTLPHLLADALHRLLARCIELLRLVRRPIDAEPRLLLLLLLAAIA